MMVLPTWLARTMECKQIRQQIHGAIYTHCKRHNVNLAIVHATKESLVRSMMDTLQQIAFCFNYSAKRMRVLQAELELDEDAKAGMNNRTKLQYTFKSAFTVVESALECLEADGNGKALSYLLSIQRFDFIITLVTIEHVLQSLLPLTTFLQAKQCDLVEAAKEAVIVISQLEQERADTEMWNTLYKDAMELAAKFEVQPSRPRNAGKQRHREHIPADTPCQYWKSAMYLPFVDYLLQEMNTRLLVAKHRYMAQYIMPKQLVHLTPERIVQLFEVFQEDMPGYLRQVQNDVSRWKARWETMNAAERPGTLDDTIQEINPDLYPNMYTAVVILMVISVLTATVERSFSAMRRLKNYLRSTMTTERMSGLVLMHVHKDSVGC